MKVMVVTASRHGSTVEIGDFIAQTLCDEGLDATSAAIGDGSELADADAVVLGSALYMGTWLEPAQRLVAQRASDLARLPLWLFSVGPLGDPPEPADPAPDEMDRWVAVTCAREHRVLRGRLDRSDLSQSEQLVVKAVGAPEGDFRDWEVIRDWAVSIAEDLDDLEHPATTAVARRHGDRRSTRSIPTRRLSSRTGTLGPTGAASSRPRSSATEIPGASATTAAGVTRAPIRSPSLIGQR
jgi:menaquinone-dependent protoporphyrinogen oxidase